MLAVGVAGDLQVNCHLWLLQNLYPLIFSLLQREKAGDPWTSCLQQRQGAILWPDDQSWLLLEERKKLSVKRDKRKKEKKSGPKSLEGFGNATKAWRACWRDQRNLQSLASASNFLAAYPSETPTILRFAHKGTRLKRLVPDKQFKHKSRSFWTSKWPE